MSPQHLRQRRQFSQIGHLPHAHERRRCGTQDLTPDQRHREKAAIANYRSSSARATSNLDDCLSTVTIETVFAVITNGTTNGEGYLPPSNITAQMNVLNEAFASTGFAFALRETRYYDNAVWFTTCLDDEQSGYKETIRLDLDGTNANQNSNNNVLYIYTCWPANNTLGFTYYPSQDVGLLDGVVLRYSTLPGGTSFPFNEGDTATHEVSSCYNYLLRILLLLLLLQM